MCHVTNKKVKTPLFTMVLWSCRKHQTASWYELWRVRWSVLGSTRWCQLLNIGYAATVLWFVSPVPSLTFFVHSLWFMHRSGRSINLSNFAPPPLAHVSRCNHRVPNVCEHEYFISQLGIQESRSKFKNQDLSSRILWWSCNIRPQP